MARGWRNRRGRVIIVRAAACAVVAGTLILAADPIRGDRAATALYVAADDDRPCRHGDERSTAEDDGAAAAAPNRGRRRSSRRRRRHRRRRRPRRLSPQPEEEEPAPEPPCERDAIDDYYTAAKDEVLVVPYAAGLGINDVLKCGGPGYTIDDLTDPPNGTVVKTPNDFGAFEYTPDPGSPAPTRSPTPCTRGRRWPTRPSPTSP